MNSVKFGKLLMLSLIAAICAWIVFSLVMPATKRPPVMSDAARKRLEASWDTVPRLEPGSSNRPVTKLNCLCATDYDSIGPVLRAYKEGDVSAAAGLLSRGKAIQLDEGTRLYEGPMRDNGVATVLVESGRHSGERCYLWGKFIK